jgi:hypothetical protein
MRAVYTFFLVSTLSFVLATATPPSANGSASQAVASIAISAVQDHVKAGSPVRIRATLKNTSDHGVFITRERAGRECEVDVRDVDGKLAADTKAGHIWNGHVASPDPSSVSPQDLQGVLVFGNLKSGEVVQWEFDAAKFYEMKGPGRYTIQIRRADPENPSIISSNAITVTVEP